MTNLTSAALGATGTSILNTIPTLPASQQPDGASDTSFLDQLTKAQSQNPPGGSPADSSGPGQSIVTPGSQALKPQADKSSSPSKSPASNGDDKPSKSQTDQSQQADAASSDPAPQASDGDQKPVASDDFQKQETADAKNTPAKQAADPHTVTSKNKPLVAQKLPTADAVKTDDSSDTKEKAHPDSAKAADQATPQSPDAAAVLASATPANPTPSAASVDVTTGQNATAASNTPGDTVKLKTPQTKSADGKAAITAQDAAAKNSDTQTAAKTASAATSAPATDPNLKNQSFQQTITTAASTSAPTPSGISGFPGSNHAAATPAQASASPDAGFAQTNHPTIVKTIAGQLLPSGGTMSIQLDPPELGALQVTVHIEDGVVSASFETSNDQATRILSHSLGQLKHALETQGIGVDRLHVQQSAKSDNANTQTGGDGSRRQGASDDASTQQQQQRREMMRRMWRRVAFGRDPLDLVA